MTVSEAQQQIKQQLLQHFDERETPVITAMLMEALTGLTRSARLVAGDRALTSEEENKLIVYSEKIASATPVQYILNESWFMGHRFFVNSSVLIPRPETEELVRWIIDDRQQKDSINIIDIGTGSGCIPISLKLAIQNAHVHACDISADALAIASRNASQLGADVHFIEADILKWQEARFGIYDVIVSNPPYIPRSESSLMHDNVVQHEPALALFVPNEDALVFYRAIIAMADAHLTNQGCIYFEVHEARAREVRALFNDQFEVVIKKDLQAKDRMIRAQKK
jgi:release factor glutamine methyltransferase